MITAFAFEKLVPTARARSRSLIALVSIALLCGSSMSSQAALVTWALDDVEFEDGTTATGWFVYDAARKFMVDWSMHTHGHPIRTPNVLVGTDFVGPATPRSPSGYYPNGRNDIFVITDPADAGPGAQMFLFAHCDTCGSPGGLESLYLFAPALTDAGGSAALILWDSPLVEMAHVGGSRYTFGTSLVYSFVVAGSLTAVPEPSAMMFLAVVFTAVASRSAWRAKYRQPQFAGVGARSRIALRNSQSDASFFQSPPAQ